MWCSCVRRVIPGDLTLTQEKALGVKKTTMARKTKGICCIVLICMK